jgi:propanol-preferring alcohol dehydrogenase
MKAMMIHKLTDLAVNSKPLVPADLPVPVPGPGEILLRVHACGVCHTELDEIEGRTPPPVLPVIPGHQVIGVVEARGQGSELYNIGDRLGVAWIYASCGHCEYCLSGRENLCPGFRATGRDVNGGYAEFMVAGEKFAYPIPEIFSDEEAAPLLCAGAIGYRSIRLTGFKIPTGNDVDIVHEGYPETLGLTGFGASAHLVLKMVSYIWPMTRVYVFARSDRERSFALQLGAVWAGNSGDPPPEKMDAIIDTTPAWKPIVDAMKNLKSGGRLVINAIRKESQDKESLLLLDYPAHLWMEKEMKSVANVTSRDVSEFLALASKIPIRPEIQVYDLAEANTALYELKQGKIRGAKVLKIG